MQTIRRACDVESVDDFRRYYTGWIGVGENPTVPIKYRGLDGGILHFTHLTPSKNPGIFTLERGLYSHANWEGAKQLFSFGSPPIGMVVTKGVLWFGSVLAERQWNRGFLPDRCRWTTFTEWQLRKESPTTPDNGAYDVIWNTFNPSYDTLASAFTKLDSGASCGAALNRLMGVHTLPDKEYPILCYKRWPIGYVRDARNMVLAAKYRDYEPDLLQFNADVRIE